MDIDFHYYGTYVAALTAGFDPEQAEKIAHCAQYVDDSNENRLLSRKKYGIDFKLIPTFQPLLKIVTVGLLKGFDLLDISGFDMRKVWVPFHFLPGNYQSQHRDDPEWKARLCSYTGPGWHWFPLWRYGPRSKWQFKLLCLPRSPLVNGMINDVVDNYKNKPYELHLTGVRMHVHADTWAHMYYAGTPCWCANDAGAKVFDQSDDTKKKIRWYHPYDLKDAAEGEKASPPDIFNYEAPSYLGHGRMGHLPDYPWITYQYRPKWSSKPIVKDNPSAYIQAFREMVTALKCILEGRKFNVLETEPLDQGLIAAVEKILKHKVELGKSSDKGQEIRCEQWKKAIADGAIKINGKAIPLPAEYNADSWYEEAKKNGRSVSNTDYYNFNLAASKHFKFVEAELEAEGISLGKPPS
jgi:hypothetical protein